MTKQLYISFILTILVLSSCAFFKPKINENFKRDDLSPAVVDSLEQFTNDAYKMNPQYTNDLIVALIRQNTLNVETTKEYIKILINILSIRNHNYIDEKWILSHLVTKQQEEYRRDFPDGLPAQQSIEEIVLNHVLLKDGLTCLAEEVDAHWAYFSATGDTKSIEKMENTLFTPGLPCCFQCLEWSLSSRASQNKDVYDKLTKIRNAKCSEVQNTDECIAYYNKTIVPAISDCKWEK